MAETPAIGIDLGTTNSCVGVFQDGKVKIIANDQGKLTTPSYVSFSDTERFIGDRAKDQILMNPSNTIFDVKRMIGRCFEDATVKADMKHWPFKVINHKGKPKIRVSYKGNIKHFSPEEVSSMILTKMKETANVDLNKTVVNAVITVPAYFNFSQRQATIDSAKIAGLKVLRVINEPTAAALAYGLDKKISDERNVFVFDLGGGTLDVSILTIKNGNFVVKSTAGNTHLGGEDFNNRMVDHFVKEFQHKHEKDVTSNKRALRRLRNACEYIKRKLSLNLEVRFELLVFHDDVDFFFTLSRAKFNALNDDLFRSILIPVEKCIHDANIHKSAINDIVLVGGSSRIPQIQELLQDFFDGKELNKSIDPDVAVAYGAAVQAAILQGDKSEKIQDMVLYDVTPLSLGIETDDGRMSTIIKRNSTIPIKKTRPFTTYVDNQTSILVQVYEGERSMTKHNNLLGKFRLKGIPPAPRKVPEITVTFNINADGILNVSVMEKSSQIKKKITISNRKGYQRKAIARMIKNAKKYQAEEEQEKNVIAARNNCEAYCYNLESRMKNEKNKYKISKTAKAVVLNKVKDTIQWLDANRLADKEKYDSKKKELEAVYNSTITKQYTDAGDDMSGTSRAGSPCDHVLSRGKRQKMS